MRLTRLAARNFRNYSLLDWQPAPSLNILIGDNAQGKTNLLEGIHVLATGKSWRTSRDPELIKEGTPFLQLAAEVETELSAAKVELRLANSKQIRLDDKPIKRLSELAGKLLVVTFIPENLALAKGSPSGRRQFLDHILLQISKEYYQHLSGYMKALEQRNSLLKSSYLTEELLAPWNEQLISHGVRVMVYRAQALERLATLATKFHCKLSGASEELSLLYQPRVALPQTRTASAWAQSFREELKSLYPQELRRGVTLTGPQRDDFLMLINGKELRLYGSQGQQRTAVLALHLGAVEYLEEKMGERPILLLDDVLSELDLNRRKRLLALITEQTQTILTTTRADLWAGEEAAAWQIEAGTLESL